jgi:hypothetical protein
MKAHAFAIIVAHAKFAHHVALQVELLVEAVPQLFGSSA